MKRALVTGSAGFVGRHMVDELVARGWLVDCHDIANHPLLDCMQTFQREIPVYDLVVHAAARAPHRAAIDSQPASAVYNRMLDSAMFDWALRTKQRRVLYLSSCAAYPFDLTNDFARARLLVETDVRLDRRNIGAPPDTYGWGKLAGEHLAQTAAAAGLIVHVVRPFSGYGSTQSTDFPFGAFVARARAREDPFAVWGAGLQVRDWIHIDDVVRGALAVVDADVREPVNLCTGVGTSLGQLADLVCSAAGYEPEFEFDLRAPAGVAWRVGDPARMAQVYTPKVMLEEGIARALRCAQ